MNRSKQSLGTGITFLILFSIFTVLTKIIDVKAIGPNGTEVGFASINQAIFKLFGGEINQLWYNFSNRLGYVSIAVCAIFGFVGLVQLIKGKSLKAVDKRIIALGVFYIVVISFYVFFDKVALNYRPVLEADGVLESSYPSSHTMLAICVFCTMFKQKEFTSQRTTEEGIKNTLAQTILVTAMIITRVLSCVHWITDIVGSLLISASLVAFYDAVLYAIESSEDTDDGKKSKKRSRRSKH